MISLICRILYLIEIEKNGCHRLNRIKWNGIEERFSRVIKSQLDRGINSGVLLHNSVTIANNIVYFKLFRKKDF
jgi:hypothetical protein